MLLVKVVLKHLVIILIMHKSKNIFDNNPHQARFHKSS